MTNGPESGPRRLKAPGMQKRIAAVPRPLAYLIHDTSVVRQPWVPAIESIECGGCQRARVEVGRGNQGQREPLQELREGQISDDAEKVVLKSIMLVMFLNKNEPVKV